MHTKTFLKRCLLLKERILFHFTVDLFSEGRQNTFVNVASPESVSTALNFYKGIRNYLNLVYRIKLNDPEFNIFYRIPIAPSKDSYQPAHLLINVFAGHPMLAAKDPKRLQAEREDSDQPAHADLSFRRAYKQPCKKWCVPAQIRFDIPCCPSRMSPYLFWFCIAHFKICSYVCSFSIDVYS